jgi:hypothetical protein
MNFAMQGLIVVCWLQQDKSENLMESEHFGERCTNIKIGLQNK